MRIFTFTILLCITTLRGWPLEHWSLKPITNSPIPKTNNPKIVVRNPIDAFIGIGMGATDYRQPMQRPFPFATLKIPVLDIYGSEDYPAVHRLAPIRLEAIQVGGNVSSTQLIVDGADHNFTAYTDAMAQPITKWLNSLTF